MYHTKNGAWQIARPKKRIGMRQFTVVLICSFALLGCAQSIDNPSVQKGAAAGAVTGAVIGANVGDGSGTNIAAGAVVGAAIGAVAGDAIGGSNKQHPQTAGWEKGE